MNAQLFLSQDGSQPMYRQIVERITTKVATREWVAGTALPSIRELAAANSVSVITVKRAYLELELAKVIGSATAKVPSWDRRQICPVSLCTVNYAGMSLRRLDVRQNSNSVSTT